MTNFNTKINTYLFPQELITQFNDIITNNNTSSFGTKIADWGQFHKSKNFFDFFELIEKGYSNHKSNIMFDHKNPHRLYNIADNPILPLLSKVEKLTTSLEQLLINHYSKPASDFYLPHIWNLYIDSTFHHKKLLPDVLIPQYVEHMQNYIKCGSFCLDTQVDNYFKFLEICPQKIITHDWFKDNLSLFLDYPKRTTSLSYLPYKSQKMIYEYVVNNFPNQLQEDSMFFSDLLENDTFAQKTLFQSMLQINLPKYAYENNVEYYDIEKIKNISIQLMIIMAKPDFMQAIGDNISPFNLHAEQKNNKLDLFFSTDNHDDLKRFENMFLQTLKSILTAYENININFYDNDDTGEQDCVTNMSLEFIKKHYLYAKLNDTVENKSSTPIKKMKI